MTEANNGRDENGRFAMGNPGGPGRPRRAIEREYLATISDGCPPDAWAEIVRRTVEEAKRGDAKARDWLARYLVGDNVTTLVALAAKEQRGVTADDDIQKAATRQDRDAQQQALLDAMYR
jgi:hypothetical protein